MTGLRILARFFGENGSAILAALTASSVIAGLTWSASSLGHRIELLQKDTEKDIKLLEKNKKLLQKDTEKDITLLQKKNELLQKDIELAIVRGELNNANRTFDLAYSEKYKSFRAAIAAKQAVTKKDE